jgi:hypothetical protein
MPPGGLTPPGSTSPPSPDPQMPRNPLRSAPSFPPVNAEHPPTASAHDVRSTGDGNSAAYPRAAEAWHGPTVTVEEDEDEPRSLATPPTRSGSAPSLSCGGGIRGRLQDLRSAAGAHPCAPADRLQGQTGAGVHHRCSPRVNRRDDLLRRNALQVSAGRREVGVPKLALDQWQRDPLVKQLHRVGMPELMVVPTSAQAPLSRPARYADLGENSLLRAIRAA